MTTEQRVRLAIGDLVIQVQAAQARIAELEQILDHVPPEVIQDAIEQAAGGVSQRRRRGSSATQAKVAELEKAAAKSPDEKAPKSAD